MKENKTIHTCMTCNLISHSALAGAAMFVTTFILGIIIIVFDVKSGDVGEYFITHPPTSRYSKTTIDPHLSNFFCCLFGALDYLNSQGEKIQVNFSFVHFFKNLIQIIF